MIIVAQATPIGRSAIAVVRMSGKGCIDVAKKIFSPFPQGANVVKVGKLITSGATDKAMCVYYCAPNSYTGEDMVEFFCHGGAVMPSLVVEQCLLLGCRMAQKGEFSKISFINGKQNLSTAEGVIELIDAESNLQAKASQNLLDNKLGKQTVQLQNKLTDLLAEAEAVLDYPEEDLETNIFAKMQLVLGDVISRLSDLLATAQAGKLIKYGINVAIVGKTNVGKSSLLNALLGHERAIVTQIAGTTRDTICESINYRGVKFNFVDTAGIRKATGKIEQMGIERSIKAIEDADVIISVADDDKPITPYDKPYIVVRNKCDLITNTTDNLDGKIYVSAKNGTNIERLKEEIYRKMQIENINADNVILTNLRHIETLSRAVTLLQSARDNVGKTTADCIIADIKAGWDTLGEVTGTTATQEIIDRVFEKFCLGK